MNLLTKVNIFPITGSAVLQALQTSLAVHASVTAASPETTTPTPASSSFNSNGCRIIKEASMTTAVVSSPSKDSNEHNSNDNNEGGHNSSNTTVHNDHMENLLESEKVV